MSKENESRETVSRETFDRMERRHLNNVWRYVHIFGRACDFIGRNFGDEALRRFHLEMGRERAVPTLKQLDGMDRRKYMENTCRHMNNVGGDFILEETDSEFIVRGTCASGGRYVRESGSAVNAEGVPYYCVHCPIWWQELPREMGIEMSFEIGEQGVGCAWRLKKE